MKKTPDRINIRATPKELKLISTLAKKLKQSRTKTIWQAVASFAQACPHENIETDSKGYWKCMNCGVVGN